MSNVIGALFSRFQRERSQLEQSIDELREELSHYTGIVLYGAGSCGIALLQALRRAEIKPLCFADGAPEKWGTICMGLPVEPPQELVKKYGGNILVIICINTDGQAYCRGFAESLLQGGHSGVCRMLHEHGCKHVVDYVSLHRCFALFYGDNTGNLPSCPDVDCILRHRENIERIYEQLQDALSKEIYANLLSFRLFDESPEIKTLPQEEKDFPADLFAFSAEEAFVDCGAFDGQTLSDLLLRTGGKLEAYYALEPDLVSFERLKENVSHLPDQLRQKITLSPRAAWHDENGISFCDLHGPGSFIADYGEMQAQTITIDQLLNGQKATAIKMNIEGSELAALEGARQTIRRWHPKLMIAGYHKTWDFWKIPEFMLEEGYPIYLRSYMHHLNFVFYAVPGTETFSK